jgi:NitT/TauT family transport system substrate-binding protein
MGWARGFWARVFAVAVVSATAGFGATAAENDPVLRVYGSTATMELGPVLYAAQNYAEGKVTVTHGGVVNMFFAADKTEPGAAGGRADAATNSETWALRVSVEHPDTRIIMTVAEGVYRLLGRKSAGIAKIADLKGKAIGTIAYTSSAFYLHRMLETVGLSEDDVKVVHFTKTSDISRAMIDKKIDAMSIWEPEVDIAKEALASDAVEFQLPGLYRELFNLNSTAANLADPVKRKQIVAFVRDIIRASEKAKATPQEIWPLVAKASGYDAAIVAHAWPHHRFPGALVPDMLDVLTREEVWLAKQQNGRPPRSREQLAPLIDGSIVKEALALR